MPSARMISFYLRSTHDWRVGGAWGIVLKNLVAATLGQIADMRKREKLELQRIELAPQAELPALGRGLALASRDGRPVSSVVA